MAGRPTTEKARPTTEHNTQVSITNQALAAAAGQTETYEDTENETSWPDENLTLSLEDDLPPPAYHEIHNEVRSEKDGLLASVTDDGRVNIRVNQLNRRLSQIFSPPSYQQEQDEQPTPAPYIRPSLGGNQNVPPPPIMNIVIQVVGSMGDVRPFVALGLVLKDTYGHRVRLATHPVFKEFVEDRGLEFFSIGGDPSQLMAFMVKNPSLMPGFKSIINGDVSQRRRDVAEYLQGCWRSCYKAGDGMDLQATNNNTSDVLATETGSAKPFVADCIIANPPSFAHIHIAEKLGIPLHIMFTMPYSPTKAFPHPLANVQSSDADPQLTNYISYAMMEVLSWQGIGDIVNRFRARCLGLDPVSLLSGPGMLQRLKIPHTYCWSPALIPKPSDWGQHISISGFYFLDGASDYCPSPELQEFLEAGPPPIYIGFGSIVLSNPNAMTELIFEAAKITGQRVLLSKGWGGMGAEELRIPEGIFMLGNVPHDWLFKHVSCVVHHGGAGTTAAGINAGRPTLIVPFFGDQPFWGSMVARAGAGPDPIPHKQLTAERLAKGIDFCLRSECLERAKQLAGRIAEEKGNEMGAQSFHQYLQPDSLRCLLAPNRPAVWRIKRTRVQLSAFAACTLANANLLDFHDLKLFRSQEYFTDEGPYDPFSGSFAAACRAFGSMGMGIVEVPTETYKALRYGGGSGRKQSQPSVATSKTLNVDKISGSPFLSETNHTKSNEESSISSDLSNTNVGSLTPSTPGIGSSTTLVAPQDDAINSRTDQNRSQVRSRNDSGSGQDRDMMRQKAAHSSKGLGRSIKALIQSPMDVSVALTRGLHNSALLWGDDTVRPPDQITDFKSGMVALGKQFGYGWYDGITGLVTQPRRGAQKEGATGFAKGMGKGTLGFFTKPTAGMMGVLSHSMKGVHKEVQKYFGGDVQSYIIASRTAQGYEEWLESSDAAKEDVISRWKSIQTILKKKHADEVTLRGTLATRRTNRIEQETTGQNHELMSSTTPESNTLDDAMLNPRTAALLRDSRRTSEDSSIQETSSIDSEEDIQSDPISHPHGIDGLSEEEVIRLAKAHSEAEAHREREEVQEYEQQLRQAMEHSLNEQNSSGSTSRQVSEPIVNQVDHGIVRPRRRKPLQSTSNATASGSGQYNKNQYQDSGHLAGSTQTEFEAQNRNGEKTLEEKTEEEIVLAYVKKQSLLEQQLRNKGKTRADEALEDEDLYK